MNPDEEFARPALTPEEPKVIQWVMQYSGGLISNAKQASYVLIGFVIVALATSFFLLMSSGGGNAATFEAPLGQTVVYPGDAPPRLEPQI